MIGPDQKAGYFYLISREGVTLGGDTLRFPSKYLDFGPDCVSCLMAKKMAKKGLNGYGLKKKRTLKQPKWVMKNYDL